MAIRMVESKLQAELGPMAQGKMSEPTAIQQVGRQLLHQVMTQEVEDEHD
jgi:hypothetical protein